MPFATGVGGIAMMGGVSGKREDVADAMGAVEGTRFSGYPSPPSSLPTANGGGFAGFGTAVGALPAAETLIGDAGYEADGGRMGRGRRASEGAHFHFAGRPGAGGGDGGGGDGAGGVIRSGRARSGSELRCDKCGKGYKHSSCLTKHLFVPPSPLPLLYSSWLVSQEGKSYRFTATTYFSPLALCVNALEDSPTPQSPTSP